MNAIKSKIYEVSTDAKKDLKTGHDPNDPSVYVAQRFSAVLGQSDDTNRWFKLMSFTLGVAFVSFVTTSWIVTLMVVTKSHERIAIGQQLMQECDYSYMEGDTPRWRLFKYVNDKVKLVNAAAQLSAVAYAGSVIASIVVIFAISRKTTLAPFYRLVLYVAGSAGMTIWLLKTVAAQRSEGSSQLYYKLVEAPELKKVRAVTVTPLKTHLWSAIVTGIAFVALYMLSSGGGPGVNVVLLGRIPFLGFMATIWALSASFLALTAFQGTSAYNDVLVGYQSLKTEFATAASKLTGKHKTALIGVYRRNFLLARGSPGELNPASMETVLEYMMHDKGAEFPELEALSTTAEDKAAVIELREVMSKLRRHDASELRMRRWFRWLVVLSLSAIATILWPMFMNFRRYDNMQLDGNGTLLMFFVFFVLLVSAIIIVWVLSALTSVGLSPDA